MASDLDAELRMYFDLSEELTWSHELGRRRALEAERRWAATRVYELSGDLRTAARLLRKSKAGVRTYFEMAYCGHQHGAYDPAGHAQRTAQLLKDGKHGRRVQRSYDKSDRGDLRGHIRPVGR